RRYVIHLEGFAGESGGASGVAGTQDIQHISAIHGEIHCSIQPSDLVRGVSEDEQVIVPGGGFAQVGAGTTTSGDTGEGGPMIDLDSTTMRFRWDVKRRATGITGNSEVQTK